LKRESTLVLDFARDELGVNSADIILFGRSMGTGVAAYLASVPMAESPPFALVLASPYTSIASLADSYSKWLPLRHLVNNQFNTSALANSIHSPVLLIHGKKDTTIPISHSRSLYAQFTSESAKCPIVRLEERDTTHVAYSAKKDLCGPMDGFFAHLKGKVIEGTGDREGRGEEESLK
jgi:fermentation-respiration switch protein FrsA (DUF1100 family)